MLIHIEPLGCGILLPALAVGYQLTDDDEIDALSAPGEVLAIEQQAGGMNMRYPTVIGALLRLEANRQHAKQKPDALLRGLRAMAEEPDLALLEKDFPVLRRLTLTHGADYTAAELSALHELMAPYFDLPDFARGCEAFVELAPCKALTRFAQWHVMSCALADEGQRKGSAYRPGASDYFIDEANIGDVRITDERELDATLMSDLAQVGEALGRSGPPSVFLLWENSD